MLEGFQRAAAVMKAAPTFGIPADHAGIEGLLLYPGLVCRNLAGGGWTKPKIKERLAEELWYGLEEVKDKSGIIRACREKGVDPWLLAGRFRLYTDPQRIRIVTAGGDHPSRGMWIPNLAVEGNVEVELPGNWDQLLAQAERELGPLPGNS